MFRPLEHLQMPTSGVERIIRDVYSSPLPFKSTSLIPNQVWDGFNSTENVEMKSRIKPNGEVQMGMVFDSSGNQIHKRSSSLTRLALSHPKCATNVTSYVGQTAKMHCCLARLDRDLSVGICYIFFCLDQSCSR